MKKSAVEVHQKLLNTYGETALSERTCQEWFQRFKDSNFDVDDRHGGGREMVFQDVKLEVLLDQNSCQTQEEMAGSLRVT